VRLSQKAALKLGKTQRMIGLLVAFLNVISYVF